MGYVFQGRIKNGKVQVYDNDKFKQHISSFKENTLLEVEINKKRKRITNPQIRYYYGAIVKPIADFTGHPGNEGKDEIDSGLKSMFLRQVDDYGIEYTPSKTQLSTILSEQFFEDCRRWAAEKLGMYIQTPDEYKQKKYDFF